MRHQSAAALLLSLTTTLRVLAYQTLYERASYTSDIIRGVNLGGWLVTEQWITPSLYDSISADDEWSLCNQLGKTKCHSTLNSHWKSFYTRDDFVDIQAAGLNAVRIPLGYWAVDVKDYEPYISGQYPYLIQAVQWARELGLSVLIDLHGAPGSQNGQDNSGLIGPVLFPSNTSNVDRSLYVLRNLTKEFSTDAYGGAVTGIELLNEPRLGTNATNDFSMTQLKSFYSDGAQAVRRADSGNGINVTIHDAFYTPQYWSNYSPTDSTATSPADGLTVDTHQYYAFAPQNVYSNTQILDSVCNMSRLLKQQQSSSGIPSTLVGEFSLQTGGNSNPHTSNTDSQARRTWFRLLFEAQIAAYSPNGPGQSSIGWMYWAWKTEYDIDTWSYRRGVEEGYIPKDVGNGSMLVFPVGEDGCVDASHQYTAPKHVGGAGGRVADSLFIWLLMAVVVLLNSYL